jgi:hypothetical protein
VNQDIGFFVNISFPLLQMTFGVITKVVEHRILHKFGVKEYLIHLSVLEIERQEWGALSRMYV